ncbi:MAG: hypothetical protein KatS3mg112_1621 [Thermogutta sp.]|nr:MAG: hypothetical protein KatS3mg112_1621 [Thermogutta sp.]
MGLFRQAENEKHVTQRRCHGLVDEHGFAGRNHLASLFQVRPTVHTFDQHGIHVRQHRLDRIEDVQPFPTEFFRITGHPLPAEIIIRHAVGIPGHHFEFCQNSLRFRVVDDVGEGDRVGGVQPNKSELFHPGTFSTSYRTGRKN